MTAQRELNHAYITRCRCCKDRVPRDIFNIFALCEKCVTKIDNSITLFYMNTVHRTETTKRVIALLKTIYACDRYKEFWKGTKNDMMFTLAHLTNIYEYVYGKSIPHGTFAGILKKLGVLEHSRFKPDFISLRDKSIKQLFVRHSYEEIPEKRRA